MQSGQRLGHVALQAGLEGGLGPLAGLGPPARQPIALQPIETRREPSSPLLLVAAAVLRACRSSLGWSFAPT